MSTPILTRTGSSGRLALVVLASLAACATVPEVSAPRARQAAPEAESDLPPVAEPPARLEESAIGDESGFKPASGRLPTPALAALDTAPTPSAAAPAPVPQAIAGIRPPDTGAPPPGAEPESLLTHVGPKTPPNVAAAMRLVEDGRQQLAQGRYDQALERFERGVAIDPTNAYGYYYLAQLYYLMKKYDQANAFAGRAVTLAVRTDHVWLARAYGLQGAVFEEVGRYADARRAYQKAVQADPNNTAARVGMTRLGGGQ
jgi:TolA-binding protein